MAKLSKIVTELKREELKRDEAGLVVHVCGGMLYRLWSGAIWCMGCDKQWEKTTDEKGKKNELHS